jgi:hypothetical protein
MVDPPLADVGAIGQQNVLAQCQGSVVVQQPQLVEDVDPVVVDGETRVMLSTIQSIVRR